MARWQKVPSRLPHPYWSGEGTPLRSSRFAGIPLRTRKCPCPLVPSCECSTSVSRNLDRLAAANLLYHGTEGNFSSHSFRIGAATVAARNGIPDHLIQALGRWTSNAYQLYIRTPSEALAGFSGQLAWHRLSLPLVIPSSFYIAVQFSTELLGACTAVFGVALTVSCFHLVSVSVFRCNCCAWCLGLLESEVPFHPCSLAPPFSSTKEFPVGWGPLAGLPWIPPPHARALPGSTNFVGTNAQAHLLVMTLIRLRSLRSWRDQSWLVLLDYAWLDDRKSQGISNWFIPILLVALQQAKAPMEWNSHTWINTCQPCRLSSQRNKVTVFSELLSWKVLLWATTKYNPYKSTKKHAKYTCLMTIWKEFSNH